MRQWCGRGKGLRSWLKTSGRLPHLPLRSDRSPSDLPPDPLQGNRSAMPAQTGRARSAGKSYPCVTIAIAYPLTACVLIEQIFIMPEVKVNRKNGALKSFPAAAPGTRNSGDTILNFFLPSGRFTEIKYGVPGISPKGEEVKKGSLAPPRERVRVRGHHESIRIKHKYILLTLKTISV